jgi:hypothetical protein
LRAPLEVTLEMGGRRKAPDVELTAAAVTMRNNVNRPPL